MKSLSDTSRMLSRSSISASGRASRRNVEEVMHRDPGVLGSSGSATASCVFPGKSLSLAGPHLLYLCHGVLDWIDSQSNLQS